MIFEKPENYRSFDKYVATLGPTWRLQSKAKSVRQAHLLHACRPASVALFGAMRKPPSTHTRDQQGCRVPARVKIVQRGVVEPPHTGLASTCRCRFAEKLYAK